MPPGRITTIYNPVVTSGLRLAEEEPNHPWFEDGRPPVLGAGRLATQKDYPTLIEAFRRVQADTALPAADPGDWPMRGELESRVRALGLEAHVMPWMENPYAFMARARLFVLSLDMRAMPREALAVGCPRSLDWSDPAEILGRPRPAVPRLANPRRWRRSCCDRPPRRQPMLRAMLQGSLERATDRHERVILQLTQTPTS